MRPELKQRIERQKLNPGAEENFFARNLREDLFHYTLGSFVAVTDWQLDQLALRIDQSVIDAPTIDSDASNCPIEFARTGRGLAQSQLNLLEDLRKIPTQMASRFGRWILKTADFFEQKLARVRCCQKYPSTASAQIDSDVERSRHRRQKSEIRR